MRHEFALYTAYVTAVSFSKRTGDTITFFDEFLWHRLKHVLRAQSGIFVYLFDHTTAIEAKLLAFENKNKLIFSLVNHIQKIRLTPNIIVLLPLLKREAFNDALYSCVELGATQIQLVTTEKSHHIWSEDKDRQRNEKIMIAAAEQSKQFSLPTLASPIPLSTIIHTKLPDQSFRLYCDPNGISLWKVIHQIEHTSPETLIISVGPEGDFVDTEKAILCHNRFLPCALTPTVLRSTQALVIALGALRSRGNT